MGISQLRRINPLVALVPIAITFVMGASKSRFGHIDTVGGIFPIMSLVSSLNPLAGLLSAASYGVGDLLQKFATDDVFYEGVRTGGDYWGARGGYLIGYSSLAVFGTLPGILARVGSRLAVRIASSNAQRGSTVGAMAAGDGLSSGARAIAAAIGGLGGGVLGTFGAAQAFKALIAPAFLLRPTPDLSCFALSRGNVGAAAGGAMVAGGAGGGAAGGITEVLPPVEPRELDPRDKDECGAFLHELDGRINVVIASLSADTDERNRLWRKKGDIVLKSAEIGLHKLEAEMQLAKLESFVIGKVGWTLVGGLFWAVTAKLVAAVGTTGAVLTAWGIRGWRASKLVNAVNTYWDELKLAAQIAPDLPRLHALLQEVRAAVQAQIAELDAEAKKLEPELEARAAALESKRANLDTLWERRKAMFDRCRDSGMLPAGTWDRPRPEYNRDDEGALISVR